MVNVNGKLMNKAQFTEYIQIALLNAKKQKAVAKRIEKKKRTRNKT